MMIDRAFIRRAALIFASVWSPLLSAGCSDSTAGPEPVSPCASMRDACLVDQKVCAVGPEGPRCESCAPGTYASKAGTCDAIGGTAIAHDFADFSVKAGEEIENLCQSWTLNNPTELWVNGVELSQDVVSHHSNWTWVPADQFEGPDGVWPCGDRDYSQFQAALYGGVLYAQSTQATNEVQKFPNGAAVRIAPYARIIGDVHLLNTTNAEVKGHAKLTLYTVPKSEVKVKLAPFHLDYRGLDIPAHASSRFTGECELEGYFPSGKMDMDLYYVLPHTHSMAKRFFFEIMGGPMDGHSLIEIEGFNGEARGRGYDPPIDLRGATGLRFGCEYDNPRDENVGWGFGDQEMCELLAFGSSQIAWESTISVAEPAGEDGPVKLFSGACDTVSFLWDHNKPGGPPPP
jgi:hypothetical protein